METIMSTLGRVDAVVRRRCATVEEEIAVVEEVAVEEEIVVEEEVAVEEEIALFSSVRRV